MTSFVSPQPLAVERFIPDVEAAGSAQTLAACLRDYATAGSLVLDPFCQSADVVRQVLAAQCRVIAISFNPLDALRTRLAVSVIPAHELEMAVSRLADSPKADAPLREHLQRLYRTTCRKCLKTTMADYFIWERDHALPSQVHYHCAACGDLGLHNCDETDTRVLQEVQPRGLHYWHILERVVGAKPRTTKFVASLLELYTPRNLYVLSNVQLKIESLFSSSSIGDYLRLGLLRALEQGNKLHAAPGEAAPPHALGLHPPPRFVEWNAWQLFEQANRELTRGPVIAPVVTVAGVQELLARAPSAPPAAFVGHLTVRELAPALPPGSVSLIWAQPPSLGRTQWALPYLWTGWLYGHEQAAFLWPMVRRHSSNWAWYLQAMRATLLALQNKLTAGGHMVLLGLNKGLAFHEALTMAAAGASLRLEDVQYHAREPEAPTRPFGGLRGDYRALWVPGPAAPAFPVKALGLTEKLRDIAVSAAEETLQARGEPAPFARLHCHIWEALARRGILQRVILGPEPPAPLAPRAAPMGLDWVREQIQSALQSELRQTFVQLWDDRPSPPEAESATASHQPAAVSAADDECLWWLAHPPQATPLTERVEKAVHDILSAADVTTTGELLRAIYARFPGPLTPATEWVMACLKSYGQQTGPARWSLRSGEHSTERTRAHENILYTLQDLGRRCGYEARLARGLAMRWVQSGKQPLVWAILDTAALSSLLDASAGAPATGARPIAILLDARQDLLRMRWMRSPYPRRELVSMGWQFIHAQDLHYWATRQDVTLADLDALVNPDPLAPHSRTQLSLI